MRECLQYMDYVVPLLELCIKGEIQVVLEDEGTWVGVVIW